VFDVRVSETRENRSDDKIGPTLRRRTIARSNRSETAR
jgi:hypothetical protein